MTAEKTVLYYLVCKPRPELGYPVHIVALAVIRETKNFRWMYALRTDEFPPYVYRRARGPFPDFLVRMTVEEGRELIREGHVDPRAFAIIASRALLEDQVP